MINYKGKQAYMSVGTDITERKCIEEKLHYMAYHDKLTGLPNRYMLNDYLQKSLARCKRSEQKLAVLFLDLDRFKFINDIKGHNAGDDMLKQVTDRLVGAVREDDIVSRLGGDEFIIVLEDIEQSQVKETAKRILETFTYPFLIQNEEFFISTSIGISMFPDDGANSETLIKNADIAMYLAKKRGKNNYQFFIQEPEAILERRIKLEKGLRRAIENNEFILYYQPQYELTTGKIKGLEALLRWNHPELGFVPPSEFIPIAEEVGMIVNIGKWVIETACQQNKKWREEGTILRVAVNVSPLQFEGCSFHRMLKQILDEIELPPEFLEIEITEGIMQNLDVSSDVINELKRIGVKISLDDFGTGYSSLNVLNRLPIDYLKIDKSFVNEISSNSSTASLVKTIISIGENFKFDLIAEGIETEEQAEFLKQNGCCLGQGYLYSPPLPAEKAEALIREKTNKRVYK